MKYSLPLSWVNFLTRVRLVRRTKYLSVDVDDSPDDAELPDDLVLREVRDGNAKWAYLRCPKCGEQIQLPLGEGNRYWRIRRDILRRPTIIPSIWQTGSCGAHFFVTRGSVVWCNERARW